MKNYIFTSESVTEGHPDKICDQIADAILDEALKQDPYSNMAVECTINREMVFIYGECNTKAVLDFEKIALDEIRRIGYTEDYKVQVYVTKQSDEIHNAVNKDKTCAGDQGIMFGYACNETPEYMPAPIYYSSKLARQLDEVRRQHPDILKPDGKTQVTVQYNRNGKVKRVDTVVVSSQHSPDISQEDLRAFIIENVIHPVIPKKYIDEETKFFVNPSGSFTVGGSFADSGTTGRKIVCDTYGGVGRIGGGCFSSKDPTKVDRSAAYYCRYVAKNLVKWGIVEKCEIQVAYAIGKPDPVSVSIDTFGTCKYSEDRLLAFILYNFDFSVDNIINELNLRRPIYHQTACYGHFGNYKFPWEKYKKMKIMGKYFKYPN